MPENPFHHTLVELIDEGIVYHLPDGQVSYGNPAALRILGVTRDQLMGKTSMDPQWKCIYPDGRDYPGSEHPAAISLQTGQPVKDAMMGVYNFRESRFRWISISSFPQKDEQGNLTQVLITLRDITEQKEAEEAEKETSQTLRTLFDAMEEMVVLHQVVLDAQGLATNYRLTDCNRAFTRITGISRDAAVGKLATEVYGVNEPPYLHEFSQVGLTGTPYFFETYFAPMEKYFAISVVSPGTLTFATVSNDITPVKKIQQHLAAKNRELEQIVYVASHDLRSPLVNVDGYARELGYSVDELREELSDGAVAALADMNESINHIRSSAQQMDKLLKGLLKLSRFGRAAIEVDTIQTKEVVDRVLESLEYQIQQQEILVEVGDLPPCRGDYVQVTQVFSNLIGNAIKYLDPQRPGRISIRGFEDLEKVWYSVEDNGIGIKENHRESIFEIFHRLDPAKTEGEGLGLTIVRQLLERMNGEIRVESRVGEGSTFLFYLPKVRVE